MSVQLPAESFAETRACLEARARAGPTDGETPWDQRLCDAFVALIHSGQPGGATTTARSPYFVVVHVPLAALVDEEAETTELGGELERDGLISIETVRQITCDATVAIGVDDDVGHTMYEGRARREPSRPSAARSCAGTATAASRAAPMSPSPTSTTSCAGSPAARPTSKISRSLCLHHHHLVHRGDGP